MFQSDINPTGSFNEAEYLDINNAIDQSFRPVGPFTQPTTDDLFNVAGEGEGSMFSLDYGSLATYFVSHIFEALCKVKPIL